MLGRYVCGAEARLPDVLGLATLDMQQKVDGPEAARLSEVKTRLRCTLEHADGLHQDIVMDLRGRNSIWAEWESNSQATAVHLRRDCPLTDEDTGEGCSQYEGHDGGHTWEVSDPLLQTAQAMLPGDLVTFAELLGIDRPGAPEGTEEQ